ncbi:MULTISPECIES: hypothetical protein [Pseudomonadaceae]|uniref:hypothetical protein n=1 Tax=Pseudomonadaceae TaxID=135621 RepID=UPI00117AF304|nr:MULTISPECIES: hypothetical protein [Pseudomonadaceae]TRO36384.1 hypothetical protein EQ845_10775 [Pseudomonas putida]
MAEYTITIKDEGDGLSIAMAGPASSDSKAAQLAQGLFGILPGVISTIAQRKATPCDCEQCKAARGEHPTSNKTIH